MRARDLGCGTDINRIQASFLLASFYPRYFSYYEHAVTLYTHSSDQYSVLSTRASSFTAREALYVLGGLLENDTILRQREHYTDTHGFTEQRNLTFRMFQNRELALNEPGTGHFRMYVRHQSHRQHEVNIGA